MRPIFGIIDPSQFKLAELPAQGNVQVLEHSVGYTEVKLSNGDTVRLHLFVDGVTHNAETNNLHLAHRVVTEVISRNPQPVSWHCPGEWRI